MSEQPIFCLRGRELRDRLKYLPMFVPWWAVATALTYLWDLQSPYRPSLFQFAVTSLVILVVSLVVLFGIWVLRTGNAHLEIGDDAIVLRLVPAAGVRVALDDVSSIAESRATWGDFLGLSGLHPSNATLLALPHWPTKTLRLRLEKGVTFSRWLPFPRYRTLLFDPEDRVGFLSALRRLAPHVTIDPALVE